MALEDICFNKQGLIPAITQEYSTGEILMFAFMNKESLALSIKTGEAIYYSRSRAKLWHKGEESGHIQIIKELLTDCDNDVILLKVEQVGGISCHTGRKSCFFKTLKNGNWRIQGPILKDPAKIYNK